ncbi:MAG: hypothetical protein J5I93_22525 [Pirellulaceae bacterium]|nr:hypothetical protein [Pirellulaceae bacterium]
METATSQAYRPPGPDNTAARPRLLSVRFWVPALVCAVAALAVPLAFLWGGIVATTQVYQRRAAAQQVRIEAFLNEDPGAFGNLSVEQASDGWAYPLGEVASQADYDRLASKLREMFGDELAEAMLGGVSVR